MVCMDLPDSSDENDAVTLSILPHTADVVREYCAGAEMDTDVDPAVLPTSMNEDATLTRKQWFDLGTTLLNADDDSLRADHYGRRVMRKVHNEVAL